MKLWIFSDEANSPHSVSDLRVALACAPPGTVSLIVRDRELPELKRLALAESYAKLARATSQGVGVAGSPEIAARIGCTHLHLGRADVDPRKIRSLNPALFLSMAWHWGEPESALEAVDAVVISPVFAERKGRSVLGIEGFLRAGEHLETCGFRGSVLALGGIDEHNLGELSRAGVAGGVVMGIAREPERLKALCSLLGRL